MQLIFFSPSLKMCCVILLDILFCLTIFLITVLVSSTEELHERAATSAVLQNVLETSDTAAFLTSTVGDLP